MIRLSRLADYGVMLMSQMAREPSAVVNVQNLVEASGLSAATVSKLLATLARHGLLGSIRGRKGGYRLARSPANISMEQIIAAIDGPIALTVCVDQGIDSCSVSAFCTSRDYWHRINEAIKEALDQVSLAEVASSMPMFLDPAAIEPSKSTSRPTVDPRSAGLEARDR